MPGPFGAAKLPVGHAMSLGIRSSGKVVMETCGLMGNDAEVGVCFSGKSSRWRGLKWKKIFVKC